MFGYQYFVIETYRSVGEPSHNAVRARPVAGQGLDTSMKVECSTSMREDHPAGTKFLIRGKVVKNENGAEFLYTHFNWEYQVMSDAEAEQYIKEWFS